jgi:hypothetical protein
MQLQENRVLQTHDAAHSADEHVSLLAEVDFKWLMAGEGWWVNPDRFRTDPSYAVRFLRLAMASPSLALRDCAVSLQAQLGSRIASNTGCLGTF